MIHLYRATLEIMLPKWARQTSLGVDSFNASIKMISGTREEFSGQVEHCEERVSRQIWWQCKQFAQLRPGVAVRELPTEQDHAPEPTIMSPDGGITNRMGLTGAGDPEYEHCVSLGETRFGRGGPISESLEKRNYLTHRVNVPSRISQLNFGHHLAEVLRIRNTEPMLGLKDRDQNRLTFLGQPFVLPVSRTNNTSPATPG